MAVEASTGIGQSAEIFEPPFGNARTGQPARGRGGGAGGGDGGGTVEEDVRAYIDANVEKTRAQNDARFADVLAELRSIRESSVSWRGLWAAAGTTIVSILGLGLAFLSYASDRFDGGLTAGALDRPVIQAQERRDAEQDRKLDQILKAVERIGDKPEGSPSQGQN